MKKIFLLFVLAFQYAVCCAQAPVPFNAPGANNPLLPGYFADPTIQKFGDLYYIYATTDNEMLASGAPTVWYSKDFQNWYNYTMDVPSLSSVNLRNFWAPDILKGQDGKYYLYFGNCQAGCNIYGYVSDTPVGPWTKLHADDTPVIAHNYPRQGFPSLDAQFFQDDDGKIYAYWGTWVHYNGGYAVGELDPKTMAAMSHSSNIPLVQTPSPFEAAYMLKRNGKYILMYSSASCHDETYNVRYAYSNSPYGPFIPGANNPILSTNADKSVHGPGHHSVLKNRDDYFIVYHRHDYPMTRGGLSRQVCMDSMIFLNDSTIQKVIPTHQGIAPFIPSDVPRDLAYQAKTSASSFYQMQIPERYNYQPSHATDNNNATLWKAANNSFPQHLSVDLGEVKNIRRIMTQFEFASYYYQYKIEYSLNGKKWALYVDKSQNRSAGSPMIDDKDVAARFLKLTVLGVEKTGVFAAIWNIKVYDSLFEIPLPLSNKASSAGPGAPSAKKLLVDLNLAKVNSTQALAKLPNKGNAGGFFSKSGELECVKDSATGIKAISFTKGALTLETVPVPRSLAWNGAYTVATWVKNPQVAKEGECLASWCDRSAFYLANSYNALFYNSGNYGAAAHLDGHFDMRYKKVPAENQWHHLVLTFDGVVEKIYVDGVLDNAQIMTLASAIDQAKIIIGASDVGEYFSGLLASLRMYDYALSESEIGKLLEKTKPNAKR